jgi:sporulation protein YlmC with PRC-barrel domain
MATTTIVITYTAGSAAGKDEVTSYTVDGTAFGSLTDTQIRDTQNRVARLLVLNQTAKAATLTKGKKSTPGG